MSIHLELSEPAAALVQKQSYNQNVGGGLNKSTSFAVPVGTAWGIIGTVLNDVVEIGDLDTIEAAIGALAQVTSVNARCWLQTPASIEAADHECVVYVATRQSEAVGPGGDYFERYTDQRKTLKPPNGKKCAIWALRLPAELDDTAITALELAMQGVTGIALAEHLVDGVVSARAPAAGTLSVNVFMRIDPVPEE